MKEGLAQPASFFRLPFRFSFHDKERQVAGHRYGMKESDAIEVRQARDRGPNRFGQEKKHAKHA